MSIQIGIQLRQAREASKISIEELAQHTRIEPAHIIAIEQGEFDQLPGPIYVRSYVRAYAMYVGLDPRPLTRNITVTRTDTTSRFRTLQYPVKQNPTTYQPPALPSRRTRVNQVEPDKQEEEVLSRSSRKETAVTRSVRTNQKRTGKGGLYSRILLIGFVLLIIFSVIVIFLRITSEETAQIKTDRIQWADQSKNADFFFLT